MENKLETVVRIHTPQTKGNKMTTIVDSKHLRNALALARKPTAKSRYFDFSQSVSLQVIDTCLQIQGMDMGWCVQIEIPCMGENWEQPIWVSSKKFAEAISGQTGDLTLEIFDNAKCLKVVSAGTTSILLTSRVDDPPSWQSKILCFTEKSEQAHELWEALQRAALATSSEELQQNNETKVEIECEKGLRLVGTNRHRMHVIEANASWGSVPKIHVSAPRGALQIPSNWKPTEYEVWTQPDFLQFSRIEGNVKESILFRLEECSFPPWKDGLDLYSVKNIPESFRVSQETLKKALQKLGKEKAVKINVTA